MVLFYIDSFITFNTLIGNKYLHSTRAGARKRAQKHPPCITLFLANLLSNNWRENLS